MTKANYVRGAKNTDATHTCHWPGCHENVKPAMWGCKYHWFSLPARLRARVWATFKPGQEESKTPSAEYMKVATEVQEWIAENNPEAGL